MKGKSTFTKSEADVIINLIKEKLDADTNRQKGMRAKIRRLGFYASDFGLRNGYNVRDFLNNVTIVGANSANQIVNTNAEKTPTKNTGLTKSKNSGRKNSDEAYLLNLCDEVLNQIGLRQHRFAFLRGDAGTKLPVDIYYPSLNLVIEYKEKQHTEEVKFFDRRQTVSGVGRGEQRRLYDQRRRDVLPVYGITLIEFGYHEFEHRGSKKLLRNKIKDMSVIKEKLKSFL